MHALLFLAFIEGQIAESYAKYEFIKERGAFPGKGFAISGEIKGKISEKWKIREREICMILSD